MPTLTKKHLKRNSSSGKWKYKFQNSSKSVKSDVNLEQKTLDNRSYKDVEMDFAVSKNIDPRKSYVDVLDYSFGGQNFDWNKENKPLNNNIGSNIQIQSSCYNKESQVSRK